MKNIPISKPFIGKEEIAAVNRILKSGHLTQGPEVLALENQFKKICQTKYALAVSNGTTALLAALQSLNLKSTDEVITTPFTFVATINSIIISGAKVVLADIDESTFNISAEQIGKKITTKTRAIIAVNLFGQTADYTTIKKIIKGRDILLIEDAAQSIGATHKHKPSGMLADLACFSLYATKNITSGEGGMVTTNNSKFYQKMLQYRQHGTDGVNKYLYHSVGNNYRMTDIHAAIGVEQTKKLDFITKKRQDTAKQYDQAFANLKWLITPKVAKDNTHVYHQYTLRILNNQRESFMNYLNRHHIDCGIYYPQGIHQYQTFKHLFTKKQKFPITETVAKQVVSIPIHPWLNNQQIKYIIKCIQKYEPS